MSTDLSDFNLKNLQDCSPSVNGDKLRPISGRLRVQSWMGDFIFFTGTIEL